MNEIIWYLNITLTQVIELLESGKIDLAISFLKPAKRMIKYAYPEEVQASER